MREFLSPALNEVLPSCPLLGRAAITPLGSAATEAVAETVSYDPVSPAWVKASAVAALLWVTGSYIARALRSRSA